MSFWIELKKKGLQRRIRNADRSLKYFGELREKLQRKLDRIS